MYEATYRIRIHTSHVRTYVPPPMLFVVVVVAVSEELCEYFSYFHNCLVYIRYNIFIHTSERNRLTRNSNNNLLYFNAQIHVVYTSIGVKVENK